MDKAEEMVLTALRVSPDIWTEAPFGVVVGATISAKALATSQHTFLYLLLIPLARPRYIRQLD